MSHEVLIARRQSIFDFFAYPGRGGPQKAGASWCWLPGMLRPASAWICKKIKNAFSSGYQDLSPFDHQSLIHSDLNHSNMDALKSSLWYIVRHAASYIFGKLKIHN